MRKMSRREALKVAGAAAVIAGAWQEIAGQAPKSGLASWKFEPLTLGEVRPAGWLRRQLRIQADGLGGHLDEFWPDVGPNSGWLGGTGESWERGPYFLDGLIPLAVLLDDDVLKAKAKRFVDWTLNNQAANGMIGPATNDDWWPRMVMVKALAQWQESTGDPRVTPVLTKYFRYQLSQLPARPLKDWGKFRWQDEVLVVEWLYARTHEPDLLKLAALLKQQGYDWEADFAEFKYTGVTSKAAAGLESHGVNNGQALKVAAVQYRLTGDASERQHFFRQLGELDQYHGMPSGMFSCDEHLAGRDPSHGTELCTVVETMFSLEVAMAAFGEAAIADRLEKIAFNALPGTFTDDMWAHQYNQQPNQVQVGLNSKPWTTDGPESNLYGLEPNFGCCTANFHQGWPKFAASLWMRTPDDGLVAAVYSPSLVDTKVRGVGVRVAEETDYPFRDNVRFTITPEKSLRFPLSLRIPAWANGATVMVNGKAADAALAVGSYTRVERVWQPGDVVEVRLPMKPRAVRGFNQSVSLERGPLVFSLDLHGSWVKLRDRGMTADWQVFPSLPWNYGLAPESIEVVEAEVGGRPFAAVDTPVKLQVRGRRVNQWLSEDGVALALPVSPVRSPEPEEGLTLIPYGAAKLRITAFPALAQEKT
jgi:hypothetical protein